MEHNDFSIVETPQSSQEQKELITLLKRQNELLDALLKNSLKSMRQEDEKHNTVVSRVIDFNMSIGSMFTFMLKWLVASIPVAIFVGVIWFVVSLVFAGALGALGGFGR